MCFCFNTWCFSTQFLSIGAGSRGVILGANHPLFNPELNEAAAHTHTVCASLLRTWQKLLHASAFLPIISEARFTVGWASAWLLNFSRTRRVKNLSRAEQKADIAIRNLSLQICTLHGKALGSGRRGSLVSPVSGLRGPRPFSAYASAVR